MSNPFTPAGRATAITFVLVLSLLATSIAPARPATPRTSGRAEHVVVLVWDGLRPDSVTEQDTPTLFKLARDGTTFARHHSVYPSSTEVNGTALATGMYPVHSGVMSNREYRPDIDLLKPIATEEEDAVRKGDRTTGGKYLLMPTVADLVQRAGRRSVVAGTKPVALLLDRAERDGALDKSSVDLAGGKVLPAGGQEDVDKPHGAFPKKADPTRSANARQDEWTTRVLIDRLWHGDVPAFTTLWLSEPDYAQHGSGPGSDVARAALRSDDDNLGRVLEALAASGVADKTDVLVVSDHGFSTLSRTVDVVDVLKKAGFDALESFEAEPRPGQVMVVANGGSVSFYVAGHDAEVTRRLVEFLQASDFAGVVFTRKPAEGTFALQEARLDTAGAPDVLVSMRWDAGRSDTGLPGTLVGTVVKYRAGQGHHASLSRYDLHNTLIAAGPDFRRGYTDELPSGNADVAPTVLWLLGLTAEAEKMDGRVLGEAIDGGPQPSDKAETRTLEASRTAGDRARRQYLRLTTLGSRLYLDEGNAGTDPAAHGD